MTRLISRFDVGDVWPLAGSTLKPFRNDGRKGLQIVIGELDGGRFEASCVRNTRRLRETQP